MNLRRAAVDVFLVVTVIVITTAVEKPVQKLWADLTEARFGDAVKVIVQAASESRRGIAVAEVGWKIIEICKKEKKINTYTYFRIKDGLLDKSTSKNLY